MAGVDMVFEGSTLVRTKILQVFLEALEDTAP